MLEDGVRICDVCGEEITKGEKFNEQTVSADRVALFLATVQAIHDYEMQPAGTYSLRENPIKRPLRKRANT